MHSGVVWDEISFSSQMKLPFSELDQWSFKIILSPLIGSSSAGPTVQAYSTGWYYQTLFQWRHLGLMPPPSKAEERDQPLQPKGAAGLGRSGWKGNPLLDLRVICLFSTGNCCSTTGWRPKSAVVFPSHPSSAMVEKMILPLAWHCLDNDYKAGLMRGEGMSLLLGFWRSWNVGLQLIL